MTDDLTRALARNLHRSITGLRVAVQALEGDHAEASLRLAVEEAQTLSKAANALAKRLGERAETAPAPRVSAEVRVEDHVELFRRAQAEADHGRCDECGGVLGAGEPFALPPWPPLKD